MKTGLWIILGLVLAALLHLVARHKSLYPFMPLRHNFGKRHDTFRRALQLLGEGVEFHLSDSIGFLSRFGDRVDFSNTWPASAGCP